MEKPFFPDSQAPVQILRIHEKPLIEAAHLVQDLPAHEKKTAAGSLDLMNPILRYIAVSVAGKLPAAGKDQAQAEQPGQHGERFRITAAASGLKPSFRPQYARGQYMDIRSFGKKIDKDFQGTLDEKYIGIQD